MTEGTPALLDKPAAELLREFGAGKSTPGSGCAAALMGILSANLIVSVIAITLRRRTEERDKTALGFLLANAERARDELTELFQQDADGFAPVVPLRRARDKATDPNEKRRLSNLANHALEPPTEVLFSIADVCLRLVQNGIALYRQGYPAVMGDSGAAVSAAIAAITTCIFVINLNVRSTRAAWSRRAQQRNEQLHRQLLRYQEEAFSLIELSRVEALRALQLPIRGLEPET